MPDVLRFEPTELYEGQSRTVVMLGTHYVGTIAQQQSGTLEFVPHRSGPVCTLLGLPPGPHVAKRDTAISEKPVLVLNSPSP